MPFQLWEGGLQAYDISRLKHIFNTQFSGEVRGGMFLGLRCPLTSFPKYFSHHSSLCGMLPTPCHLDSLPQTAPG